jgi:hypothetical protein
VFNMYQSYQRLRLNRRSSHMKKFTRNFVMASWTRIVRFGHK